MDDTLLMLIEEITEVSGIPLVDVLPVRDVSLGGGRGGGKLK